MDQQTRERALRALVAALLSSGLSPREMREVARALKTDSSMREQLARLVNTVVENLPSPIGPKPIPPRLAEVGLPEAENFLRAAEAVELPKEDLVHRLQSFAQRPDWNPNLKWPRRRILKDFLAVAPPSSVKPALDALLAGPVEPDPYIDSILTRGKASHG